MNLLYTLRRKDIVRWKNPTNRKDTLHRKDIVRWKNPTNCKDTLHRKDIVSGKDTVHRKDTIYGKDTVIAVIMALQVLFFIVCMARIASHVSAHASSNPKTGQRIEHYISVRVRPGDSLWEISRRYYSSEYKSMGQYMKKIMRLNNMADENIHSGAYLVVPYYGCNLPERHGPHPSTGLQD